MSEKDQQNQGDSRRKHAPLTDFFRDALVPNARLKRRFRENQARLKKEWEAQENSRRKRWSIARLLGLDRPWFRPPMDIEEKFKEILNLVRPDLPDEIYQDYFDLADKHNETPIAFEALCDWLERNNVPLSQDVDRLTENGMLFSIMNKQTWEILRPQVKK